MRRRRSRGKEATFQARVVELMVAHGYCVYSVRNSKAGVVTLKGYPDLTIWRPPIRAGWNENNFWLAELKTSIGALSEEQKSCIASLKASGVEVHVLRPKHLPWIVRRLKRGCYDPSDPLG